MLVELTATVFLQLEKRVIVKTSNVHLFLEYEKAVALEKVLDLCHSCEIQVMNVEVSRSKEPANMTIALLALRLPRGMKAQEAIKSMLNVDGVIMVEEF